MKTAVSILKVARFVGAVAMLGAVVAGALGYGDTVKVWAAAGGAGLAVFVKAAHLIA